MAVTKTTTITALAGKLVVDFQANATSEDNASAASSGTFYLVEIDNTANASTLAYVKIRDASSATPNNATNGRPTWQFCCPAASKTSYTFPEGQDYSAGLSLWCTTDPAHQNVSSPSANVVVKIITS